MSDNLVEQNRISENVNKYIWKFSMTFKNNISD